MGDWLIYLFLDQSFVILNKDIGKVSRYNFEKGKKVEINFDQSAHKVYRSCSVNFQNQFWIFGGSTSTYPYRGTRAVSTVKDCGLKRHSKELPEIGINKILSKKKVEWKIKNWFKKEVISFYILSAESGLYIKN